MSSTVNVEDILQQVLMYNNSWINGSLGTKLFLPYQCALWTQYIMCYFVIRGRCDRDCMIVGFKTTCAIISYSNSSFKFESRSRRGVLNTLCDEVCQWLATGRWFSPGTLVSSTNKTDRRDINEILLKVALNTITLILYCHTLDFPLGWLFYCSSHINIHILNH